MTREELRERIARGLAKVDGIPIPEYAPVIEEYLTDADYVISLMEQVREACADCAGELVRDADLPVEDVLAVRIAIVSMPLPEPKQ
jgi:hypothetical protein